MSAKPVTVLCLYRVKEGSVEEFQGLLAKHWPALDSVGLVTDEPARHWLSHEKGSDAPVVVEIFSWKDASMPGRAHELPEVMAVWEPMGGLCEERGNKPSMEFLDLAPLVVEHA